MYEHSKITKFFINGPILISPKQIIDERGSFCETFRAELISDFIGENIAFVQDNLAHSKHKGTIRGLHGQKPPNSIGKLVQCLQGEILDVCVDLRKNSPSFGKYISTILSSDTHNQLWIPAGFAHGYETLCDNVLVGYKQTGYYHKDSEFSIFWNDKDIAINWHCKPEAATLSDKDKTAPLLKDFESPF